jgi:formylglycine-generating enzyme required for sulfatase activity
MFGAELSSQAVHSLASRTSIQKASSCVLSVLLCFETYSSVETEASAEAGRGRPLASLLTVAKERAADPRGSEFRECQVTCPLMVAVPTGQFTMGSSETDVDRTAGEGPQHEVSIAERFAVSKYEITFDQWDACVQLQLAHEPRTRGAEEACP